MASTGSEDWNPNAWFQAQPLHFESSGTPSGTSEPVPDPFETPSGTSEPVPDPTESPSGTSEPVQQPSGTPSRTSGPVHTSQPPLIPVTSPKTWMLSRFRKSGVLVAVAVVLVAALLVGYLVPNHSHDAGLVLHDTSNFRETGLVLYDTDNSNETDLVPSPNFPNHHCHDTDLSWILTSASSLDTFPLPHPVDERRHKDLLNERFPGILNDLVRARSNVCSSLMARSQKLNQHLAKATKIFFCSNSDYTASAFLTDITVAHEQLSLADSQIDSLADLYYSVRERYYTLDATAAEALDQARLDNRTEFFCFLRYWMDPWFGHDAHATYYYPLKQNLREIEQIRSGMVVLEREIQRLEKIKLVIKDVVHILQDLAIALTQWMTKSPSRDSIQQWLREWFQQHFVLNGRLKEIWSELLMSVDKREQRLALAIATEWQTEWQERPRT